MKGAEIVIKASKLIVFQAAFTILIRHQYYEELS